MKRKYVRLAIVGLVLLSACRPDAAETRPEPLHQFGSPPPPEAMSPDESS